MVKCGSGQIPRIAHCKSMPKRDARCKGINSTDCKIEEGKGNCKWIPEKCVPDQGQKGKTPKSKRWSEGIEIKKGGFSKFFPQKKMVLTKTACKAAGKVAKKAGVSLKSMTGKLNFRVNINPHVSGTKNLTVPELKKLVRTLNPNTPIPQKPTVPELKKLVKTLRRKNCQAGLRAAYGKK